MILTEHRGLTNRLRAGELRFESRSRIGRARSRCRVIPELGSPGRSAIAPTDS